MFTTENEIWRAVLPVVRAGVAGFDGVVVKRAYQPSTQADGTRPRVALHRVSSRRYGSQGKQTFSRDGVLFEREIWRKEDTFQANAVVDRAPDDEGFTAKDVLEALGGHLQSQAALDAFRKSGLGILRVNDIMETPYEDSRDVFRFSVSLKFTLTYTQTTEREIPKAARIEWGIRRV